MSFTRWLRNLRSALAPSRMDRKDRRSAAGGLRAATHRPRLELLEDRTTPSFSPAVSYPAGASPQAIVSGLFNDDAFLDLAIANTNDSTVSVLLGNGDGTFQPAVNSPTGSGPLSLAVGDFNADGKLDLATANNYSVSVLLGNGDGAFQTPTDMDIGSNPQSVAVGDFDADGKMDLGVTSNIYHPGTEGTPGTPGYYHYHPGQSCYDPPGTGSGCTPSFGYYHYHPGTPGTPGTPGYYEGRANVLLGNGDGSFALTGTQSLGGGNQLSASVAVGDFDKDGKLDLVATETVYYPGFYSGGSSGYGGGYEYDGYGGGYGQTWNPGHYKGRANVLLGNGDGTLRAATGISIVSSPTSVAAGDLNGDGNLDLVTANGSGNDVSVLLGTGTGAFGTPQSFGAGSYPVSVVLGDFNHDNILDIATANNNSSDVSVLRGLGDGAFTSPVTSPTGSWPSALAAGDFNGDGWLDAATANPGDGTVSVLINNHSWPPVAPSISINDVTVTEGNTGTVNATFTVSLSAAYAQPVTVHYQTANGSATAGSDYSIASGDVTFGIGETSKTITVLVNGDVLNEVNENFTVNLTNPTNATIADGQGVGAILNDDPVPTLTINDVSRKEGNSGITYFVFTVSLSAASGQMVTVSYATADSSAKVSGNDYVAASGTLTFAPGETTKTITVVVKGDRKKEASENFFLNLTDGLNAVILVGQGIGTIQNDD